MARHILVINADHTMAKRITSELKAQFDSCIFTYAPTLALAATVLKKRPINLVVSSAVLPDGSATTLRGALSCLTTPPAVIIVGDLTTHGVEMMRSHGYECRSLAPQPSSNASLLIRGRSAEDAISSDLELAVKALGANIRNDLNNPLQEIVTMVFVAQNAGVIPEMGAQALSAIESAAQSMAGVVKNLEARISQAVIEGRE